MTYIGFTHQKSHTDVSMNVNENTWKHLQLP